MRVHICAPVKTVPIGPTVIGDFRNIRGMKVILIRKEHMPLAVFFYEIHDMTSLTFVLVSKRTNKNSVGAVNSDTRRYIRTWVCDCDSLAGKQVRITDIKWGICNQVHNDNTKNLPGGE